MIKSIKRFLRAIYSKRNTISIKWLQLRYSYFDINVYYSKGTSLIENLKNSRLKVYEEETCKLLSKELSYVDKPVFIDIGANIGLISIYIIQHIRNVKIYAFEPGPHQYKLFNKTIKNNNLKGKIELENIALSNINGTTEFCIHSSKDVSGDGFIDTKRAGKTIKIEVQVKKLDTWWLDKGKPNIDVIKIDTEGAELWVLEGAAGLIKTCKPKILTEICMHNYANYPYNEYDILNYLNSLNYSVFSEDMSPISSENLKRFQESYKISYICIPN